MGNEGKSLLRAQPAEKLAGSGLSGRSGQKPFFMIRKENTYL
jgi:hypothetical protein